MEPIPPRIIEIRTDLATKGQIYYSLKEDKIIGESGLYDWDLGFDCRYGQFNIIVNSAKGMAAFNTGEKNFDHPYEQRAYPWKFDHPCGDLGMTCIGEWGDFSFDNPQSFENVYIINLGIDRNGTNLGLKKFKIHGFAEKHYLIQIAELDNSNSHSLFIPKKKDYNFTYLSIADTGEIVSIEPPKSSWDFVVSPYLDSTKDESPYNKKITKELSLSEGVLQNRYKRSVALDTLHSFDNISYFDIEDLEFSYFINTIGNRWRKWDQKKFTYEISSENRFIIQDLEGIYYALEFQSYSRIDEEQSLIRFRVKNL